MKEVLLISLILVLFIFGYFLTNSLDKFLDEKRNEIENPEEIKEPSFIVLKDHMSDDEIITEIQKFRKKHHNITVCLYDSDETEIDIS